MATKVTEAFKEFKTKLELSDSFQESVSEHHNALQNWITGSDPKIKTKLVGSLQRQTRIQPRKEDNFDIDILVILGSFHRWVSSGGITPTAALDKIEGLVSEHETYERMEPETDSPTIIFEYADGIKAELIPAYVDEIGHSSEGTPTPPKGRGYWIPKNNKWVIADYDYDADLISAKNKEGGGWFIPTIKMLKSAKRNLFPELQSYHLEVMAINCLPALIDYYNNQGFSLTYPSLVYGFFVDAVKSVLEPARLNGSKSPDSSAYLSSTQREQISKKLKEVTDYTGLFVKDDGQRPIEGWREIFREPFPSYG